MVLFSVIFLCLFILKYKLNFYTGLFGVPAFVIITCRIVNIRQQALLKYLTQLHDHLKANNQSFRTQSQAFSFWNDLLQVNRLLATLCADIDRCSNYWSLPLTVYFIGFIMIQCYMSYLSFFVPNLLFFVKLFCIYVLVLINTFQFTLVHTLSKLTQCNGKLEKANTQFYLLFNQKNGFKTNTMLPLVLKVTVFNFYFNAFLCLIFYFNILGRVSTNQPPIASLLYAPVGQLPHHIKDILFGNVKRLNLFLLIFCFHF